MFENVATIGNHGLTLQVGPSGRSPADDESGADIGDITRAAPLLGTSGIGGLVRRSANRFNAPTDADTRFKR